MALQTGHVVMDRYWTSTVAFAALDDTSNINQEWQVASRFRFLAGWDAALQRDADPTNRSFRRGNRAGHYQRSVF